MGNTEEKPFRELIILQTSAVRESRKEIVEMLEERFEPAFLALEDIVMKVQQSENECRIIAEQSYRKQLEQLLANSGKAVCSYIKIHPQSKQFVQGVRQAARKFCSRKSNQMWKTAIPQIDIKFIDREVNSSSYEIFLNYMKNHKISFQLFETVSDFLISQRRSKCSYIVVSSEYANFAFNTTSKVFCFCSRNDQIQNKENNSSLTCSNNFTRIIKLILADKRKNSPQADSTPVKTLLVWTKNMDKAIIQQISRRKVKCRVIKVNEIGQLRIEAMRQLYSTVVVNGRIQREVIEDLVESSVLNGRVLIFTLKPNPQKCLVKLDHHLEYGYLLVPQRIKHLLFLGTNQFLEQINTLACLLHQENVGLSFLKEEEFQASPAYAMAVVVSHDALDRIEFNLEKLGFSTILLSVNADQPYFTLNSMEKGNVLKTYVKKMCQYLEGKLYYISKDQEVDNCLNKIVKEISAIQAERCVFTDIQFIKSQSSQINVNLKLLKFSQTETKQMEQHWHFIARMWRLNYNPLKNLKILCADLQKSFKNLVRLNMLNVTYSELQKFYLDKFNRCVSFVSYIESVRNLYMQRLQLRLCLKNVMGSIDRYAEHQKIQIIKPIVTLLICSFSALYSYPKLQPGLIRIYMQKNRLNNLLKADDIVVTNQFLEYTFPNTPEPVSDNVSFIQIDYGQSKWTPLSYYSNFISYSLRDIQTIIIAPYVRFRVVSVLENKKSTIIKLKWIQTHNPLRQIVESNTFELDLSTPVLEIFTSNSGLINYSEQNQVVSRIHFYKFVWNMQQQRLLEAQNRLMRCSKKISNLKTHPDFLISAKLLLYLGQGRINQAKQEAKKLINQNRKAKWDKQIHQIEKNIAEKMTNTSTNELIVKQLIKKWEVKYNQQNDKFCLINMESKQVFSETVKPCFKCLNEYDMTVKKQAKNIFETSKKVYLQVPEDQ